MNEKKQEGTNPSDQNKSWRSDVPKIPEGEKQPSEEPQPGTRQDVKQDQQHNKNFLTQEDLPDATNVSKGKMGSGQRQDSN